MNKFSNLKSNSQYVDFVLQNYINCYDNLNEKSIERFTTLFDTLKSCEISSGNKLINNQPLSGIKLDLRQHTPIYRNTSELNEQLCKLESTIDQSEKKEIIFFKSIVCLCDSINYLSTKELFELNDLFRTVNLGKQDLNDPISDSHSFFYSYNRYPKK